MKTLKTSVRTTCLLVALGLLPTVVISPLNAAVCGWCVLLVVVLS